MAIKNMLITPPIIGRISIGETVESNGRKLPKKSDEFHITTNVQVNGKWTIPPVPEAAEDQSAKEKNPNAKLRKIPVRIMFDSPENNFRANYSCFNNEGRQVCSGNGETAKRRTDKGMEEVECAGHDFCAYGKQNRCKPYGRLIIALESQFEKDPLSGFAFRTTGYNSVNALTFRLQQFAALTGGKIAGMPCNLVLRAKSTSASKRQAIFYTDLEPRESLQSAVSVAKQYHEDCTALGMDLAALDKSVTASFDGNSYIENDEDAEMIADDMTVGEVAVECQEADAQPRLSQNSSISDLVKSVTEGGLAAMLGDMEPEQTEPSECLKNVLEKIKAIDNAKAMPSARIWVKNYSDFANEYEREQAFDALSRKEGEFEAIHLA